MTLFLTIMTVFSTTIFIASLTPDYHSPKRRVLRGALFLIEGICAGVPIIYLIIFHNSIKGFDHAPKYHLWYLGGISYIIGGLIYVRRIPEKYTVGKNDYFGASHQFLHLFVDIGFILHFLGCLDSYKYRACTSCPVTP